MSAGRMLEVAPGRRLFVRSEGEGTPVVLLHGFTGCGEAMEPAARALPRGRRRIFVDLLGHGRSDAPADPAAYRMETCVGDLCAVLDRLDARSAHVLGYSMGARVALALAAAQPERVLSLVLVGARAGLADPVLRRERRRADEALAESILSRGTPWFVEHWMALPLFASQRRLGSARLAAARRQRLRCRPAGLAGSLRGMGLGAQAPLFDALPRLPMPVLLVAGEEDAPFTEAAAELERSIPQARRVVLRRAGHAAHLERPLAFARAVRRFLRTLDLEPAASWPLHAQRGGKR